MPLPAHCCCHSLPSATAAPCYLPLLHYMTLTPLLRHAMRLFVTLADTSPMAAFKRKQLEAVTLSSVADHERGRSRPSRSSPNKRSCVQSPSHSRSRSHLHSPPCHCRRRYASPEGVHRSSNSTRRGHLASKNKVRGKGADQPFFQAGTAVRGTSACAICLGRHEHEYAKCSATKLWNGAKASVRRNEQGRLVLSDGLPICFNFQTTAGCSDLTHPTCHVCSGCGKPGHGAQKCSQVQKN